MPKTEAEQPPTKIPTTRNRRTTKAATPKPAEKPPAPPTAAAAPPAHTQLPLTGAEPDPDQCLDIHPDAIGMAPVNGQTVIAVEPAPSNLPATPSGRRPSRRTILQLTLADGSTVMKCIDCDQTGTLGQIMSHRQRKHGTKAMRSQATATPRATVPSHLASLSLGEVLEMGQQLEEISRVLENITAQRDGYRDRNAVLEARLRRIDAALNKAGYATTDEPDKD